MGTTEIIKEIKRLPVDKRLRIIEQTLKFIREAESKKQIEKAVGALSNDYSNDKELTALTSLDFEDFYEAR
jgi:predicted metallopeptidase